MPKCKTQGATLHLQGVSGPAVLVRLVMKRAKDELTACKNCVFFNCEPACGPARAAAELAGTGNCLMNKGGYYVVKPMGRKR